MHKTRCVIELEGEEITFFFEVLIETLHVWSKKGFENEEEKAEYQRIVGVVSKLFEPWRETTILSRSYIRTLERLKAHLQKQQTCKLNIQKHPSKHPSKHLVKYVKNHPKPTVNRTQNNA